MKKFFSVLFSFMTVTSLMLSSFSATVNASEVSSNQVSEETYEEKVARVQKEVEQELKLYFEEIGELSTDGVYKIKNPELLLQTTNENSNEYTQSLFAELTERNGLEYAACIVDNTLGNGIMYEIYSMFKGDQRTVFVTEMTKHGWAKVAEMLAPKLLLLGLDFNIAGLVAKFAIAAVTCAL